MKKPKTVDITVITEKLYKEANPTSKMDVPSIAYEIIEKHYKTWLIMLTEPNIPFVEFEDYARILITDELTKEQAMLCCSLGLKITHESFTDEEYLYAAPKSKSHFLDEEGNVLSKKQFWMFRTSKAWDKGWSKYKSKLKS